MLVLQGADLNSGLSAYIPRHSSRKAGAAVLRCAWVTILHLGNPGVPRVASLEDKSDWTRTTHNVSLCVL